MNSAFRSAIPDLSLAAIGQLSGNSRLGFANRNPALHRGIEWSKSTLALGLLEWSGKTASGPVVAANNGSWLQNAWNYLKKVPVNLNVIVPVLGIAGPAVTITYLPQTNNLCVAPGVGASIGRNVGAGPLVLGNLANAKSITEGPSISVGAQALPIAGAQATGNQSGILGGPTVGIPGGSVTATYGICF
jgi:hypothetical protein